MKIILPLFRVTSSVAKYIRQNHDYWYTQKVPYVDYAWNYCDKKCLYWQNYVDKTVTSKFVVVQFTASSLNLISLSAMLKTHSQEITPFGEILFRMLDLIKTVVPTIKIGLLNTKASKKFHLKIFSTIDQFTYL